MLKDLFPGVIRISALLLLCAALLPASGCISGAPSFEPANITAEQEANSAMQLLSFGEVRFDAREASDMARRLDRQVDDATGDIRVRAELARAVALFLEADAMARKAGQFRFDAQRTLRSAERAIGVAAGMAPANRDIWLFQALIWGRASGLDRDKHFDLVTRFHGNMRALMRLPDDFLTERRWFGRRWDKREILLYKSRLYCQAGRPWLAWKPELKKARSGPEPLQMVERARVFLAMRMPREAAEEVIALTSPRYRHRTYTGEGLWMLRGCMEHPGSGVAGNPERIADLLAEISPPFHDSALMKPIPESLQLPLGESDISVVSRLIKIGAFREADVILADLMDADDDVRRQIRWRDLDRPAREAVHALNVLRNMKDTSRTYEDVMHAFERLAKLHRNSFQLQKLFSRWLESTDPLVPPPLFPGSSPTIAGVWEESTLTRGVELVVRVLDPQGPGDVASVTMNVRGQEAVRQAYEDPETPGLWRFRAPWEPQDKSGLIQLVITARDVSGYADRIPHVIWVE